jgi:parvulin-like peptidyl-prolyl isomerase
MIRLRSAVCVMLPVASVLLLSVSCRSSKAVAKIGDTTIDQTEWRVFRTDLPPGTSDAAALDLLIRREVAWKQAERNGLLNSAGWKEAEPRIRRTVLIRSYLESLKGPAMPTEDEVKGFFLSHSEERQVAHILCRTQEAAAAVRARLDKGEAFERVVASSVDPTASKNKGELGWIKRDAVVQPFAKEVFTAKVGDLCGPFQTEFGWHVALVKAKRAPSPEEFEKNKPALMAQAREMAIAPKRDEILKSLRLKYPLVVDEGVLALAPNPATAAVDGERIAGRVDDLGISLKELEAFMRTAIGQGMPEHSMGVAAKKRFLDMLADDLRLTLAAKKAGVEKKPEVKATLWEAQRQAVYQGFALNHLRKLQLTDAELQAYQAQNAEKFRGVGAIRMNILVAQNPHAAAAAATEATKGAAWGGLVKKYGNVESTGNWDPGYLELVALKKLLPPEALKALTTAPLGTTIGPVDGPEGPMLFKVLERRPGDMLPIDQCRDQVREDYLKQKGRERVETFLDGEGRKDLKIQIFKENLAP